MKFVKILFLLFSLSLSCQAQLSRDLALWKRNLVRDVSQSKQGTTFDPANGGSNLSSSYTWVLPQSRPFPQKLKKFGIYCSTGGTIILKLIVPTNGGFNITNLDTLTCSTGYGTFDARARTLVSNVVIPAGGLIGFKPGTAVVSYTSESTELYMGYLRFTGDALGSNVVTESISYNHQIQAQFETEFSNTVELSNVIYHDDCSGNVLPNYGINTTWTFSGGEVLNGGTGLDDFLDLWPITNGNDHSFKIQFQFTASGNRVAIYKKPILNYGIGSNSYGTILEADLDNNRLVFYEEWSGQVNYTLPSILSTLTLTNLTLATGVVYELELAKDNKLTMGVITDTSNGDSQILYVQNDPTNISGLAFGRAGIACLAGSAGDIKVSDIKIEVVEANPRTLFVGNSITEGTGAARNSNFATLTDYNSKSTRISPEGGSTTKGVLNRLRHELRFCKPTYVIIESVNNNADAGLVAEYAAQMPMIYQEILNAGAIPIILAPTPLSNALNSARKETNRAFLLAQSGWNICRADLELSVGNDGVTYDASKFSDGIHWNTIGHQGVLENRLMVEFPQVFAETPLRTYVGDPTHDADYKHLLNWVYTNYGEDELPDAAGQDADNALVVEAKANGLWDASPVFFNHHTNGGWRYSLVNYKNPSYSTRARKIGRPIYTIKKGWKGDALQARVDYRWSPNLHGASLYTQNDAAILVYNDMLTINNNSVMFGVGDAGNSKRVSFIQVPTGNCAVYINTETGGAGKTFSSDYQALIRVWRSSSTNCGLEKDGVELGTYSGASTGMSSQYINGLCYNDNGLQNSFSDAELHCMIPHKYSLVTMAALKTMWDNHRTLIAAL